MLVARSGSVLLVVLVIVVLLALGAYAFTELSVAESEATAMFARGVHARAFADSGIDVAATIMADPLERGRPDPFFTRPEMFSAVLLRDSDVPYGRGRYSVVAPVEQDPAGQSLRFGLIDESGKLNVNAIVKFKLDADTSRNMLMHLPNMTVDIADAILDWIDADDQMRQNGAENDYYQSLPQPYHCTNGPFRSLDELLLVRGVTAAHLWGEDLNRNGVLDPGEDLNGDGYLDRGWNAYLTIYSSERNLRINGNPRINVNHQSLPELYDQLQAEFNDDTARFVTAYRMSGAAAASTTQTSASSTPGSGNARSGQTGRGRSGSGGSSGKATGGGGQSNNNSGGGNKNNTVQRGGMSLPEKGSVTIGSIFELIDAKTTATVASKRTTLSSPWQSKAGDFATVFPNLLDTLATTDKPSVPGRINVNQASFAVLVGIPGMTEQLAKSISDAQSALGSPVSASGTLGPRATTAWLITEGLTDVATLRKLDPYLTARGDVFRAQSVGFFDDGGPVVRIEAVIDASVQPPRILMVRELTELGRGYSHQQLGVP